jgi:hypothetical protein
MVEIFKTSIGSRQAAVVILHSLQHAFPDYKMNFDLDDCDKILRVESKKIDTNAIRFHLDEMNIESLLID